MRPADSSIETLFKTAMRHLPAGVCIVTAGEGLNRRGLTATAMCSVSAEPPTILVCVNRCAEAHPIIAQERRFCVNILPVGEHGLASRFAGQDGSKGEIRFADRDWTTLGMRTPALADALVNIECELTNRIDVSTHGVFIGCATAVRVDPSRSPLVYYDRKYWRLA